MQHIKLVKPQYTNSILVMGSGLSLYSLFRLLTCAFSHSQRKLSKVLLLVYITSVLAAACSILLPLLASTGCILSQVQSLSSNLPDVWSNWDCRDTKDRTPECLYIELHMFVKQVLLSITHPFTALFLLSDVAIGNWYGTWGDRCGGSRGSTYCSANHQLLHRTDELR